MRIASDTCYRRPRHRSADARSPELPALLLITLMCFAAPTSAGTPVPDPRMVVTDGYVSAIATRDNTVYIGGAFNCVGHRTGSFVGLDPTSGDHIPEASVDRRVILVCNDGYASSLAAATLIDLGITAATDLVGGYRDRADDQR